MSHDLSLHLASSHKFSPLTNYSLFVNDCLDILSIMDTESIQLIVTSLPYNLKKKYESRIPMQQYLEQQDKVISECVRLLKPQGSICWQVGNYIKNGTIIPLDIILYPLFIKHGLQLRNRIVWSFEHGLHCKHRFSGRYETILWFTKTDDYIFNLDAIRVPQKYPKKKYFKGTKKGQYSCNPLGKNPGDFWLIPNVKHNHIEKTEHPCQFPVELVERLVLALSNKNDVVLDPFVGTGTSVIAAVRHGREGIGIDNCESYINIARTRLKEEQAGTLKTRPMNRPIYEPQNNART